MHNLLRHYSIITDQIDKQELDVILRELERVSNDSVAGDVVELGCYKGSAALFLQRLLQSRAQNKELHVYDSFAGLPPKTIADHSPAGEQFKGGELHATKAELIKYFRQAGLPLPIVHKGWFADLTEYDLPKQIAFAFLDGDFYESILSSLTLVWPRLTKGSTVIVDDYQSSALPGARRAVDEWVRQHPADLRVEASLAILKPQL